MSDAPSFSHRPYVLWFQRFHSGDSVKVYIWPRLHSAAVALHVNGRVRCAESRPTAEAAVRLGWDYYRRWSAPKTIS